MSNNVHILKGWSNIASLENVKPGMSPANIEEIENQLISGGLIQKTEDPQDKFDDQLQDIAKQFGISFGDISKPPNNTSTSSTSKAQTQQPITSYDYSDDNGDDNTNDYSDSAPIAPTTTVTPETFSRGDSELDYKTREQERRSHINSVMRDIMPHNSFNFEEEKREDAKCAMLEEIDSLIYSLQDAEVDLSRIPKVDFRSSYEEIEMVLKILRHKSDRTRYCNLAEEFFIWGAYGMEELFDGQRVWFGRYQPCLTGWHTQVQTKLRRMRHDTSQLVSEVMHDYNISPGMRVLLELIPNMFVYSSEKKKNQAQANMYTDDEMAAANERLRQFN